MSCLVTNDGKNSPNPGNSGLFVEAGDNITTSGKGVIGILAQSIGGGGGGLAGDTGYTTQLASFGSGTNHSGSGGLAARLSTVTAVPAAYDRPLPWACAGFST
jgi:hypothetical protein